MGDYHKHFVRFALGYLGKSDHAVDTILSTYKGETSMAEWFCSLFLTDIRTFRDIKLAYRQGAQKRNMPVKSWASELTHAIKERAEIWLTTTRPYLRLDGVDPDTRFWLHHNSIYYDHLLYHEAKYTVLATRVAPARVVAVVDDLPEELNSAAKNFGKEVCIMMRAQHNMESWGDYPSAHEGISLKRQLDRRIDEWYQRFGTHGVLEESGSKAQPS
jgi:hypothetical protein